MTWRKPLLGITVLVSLALALTGCMPPVQEENTSASAVVQVSDTSATPPADAAAEQDQCQEEETDQAFIVCGILTSPEVGFRRSEFRLGDDVVPSEDTSKAGPLAFSDRPIHTPEDAVEAVKRRGEYPGVQAWIREVQAATGGTIKEMENPDNHISVQFLTKVNWQGNSSLDPSTGKVIYSATGRVDDENAIGVFFVPPKKVKAWKEHPGDPKYMQIPLGIMRGVCGNPQRYFPMPVAPDVKVTPEDEVEVNPSPTPEKPTTERPRPTPTPEPSDTPKPTPTPEKPKPSPTPTPTPTPTPPTEEECPYTEPPASYTPWGIPDSQKRFYGWDYEACAPYKLPQSEDDMLNNDRPSHQDPQDNDTAEDNGANTGDTPGTSTEPTQNPVYTPPPADEPPAPAPTETPGGYRPPDVEDEAPDGTGTNDGDTDVGDHGGTDDPDDTGQGGNNGIGDDGESDGSGTITDPDAP